MSFFFLSVMRSHPRSLKLLVWSVLSLFGAGIVGLGAAPKAVAQVNNADSACYLHSPDGQQYDLSALCGGFIPPAAAQPLVLQTGDVQVTLRWDTDADLDLYVIDPFGDEVSFSNPRVPSGGQLDVDANAGCFERMASPVENIFWPTGEGATGDYTVVVTMFAQCENTAPADYTLDILAHGEIESHTGSISDEMQPGDRYPFSLSEVTADSQSPAAVEGTSRLPDVPQPNAL